MKRSSCTRRFWRFSQTVLLILVATQATGIDPARLMSFGMRQTKARKEKAPEEALATFSGTVRAIDGKILRLDSAEGEPLDFNVSRKTKYYDGPKEIKRDAIKSGDHVTVEARPMPDGKPDAVKVHLDHPPVRKEPVR
jgi:hypothetical protein